MRAFFRPIQTSAQQHPRLNAMIPCCCSYFLCIPVRHWSVENNLSSKYGPLSQLHCKFSKKTRSFKAAATMRQCGFPVELASVEGPTAEEASAGAIKAAMELDVVFLDPRLRIATASSL
eukprot:Tbor_TRINITY_DN9698_c0_g1::TRINITY_DN9698_c0_g1_i1::g.23589::m.23589